MRQTGVYKKSGNYMKSAYIKITVTQPYILIQNFIQPKIHTQMTQTNGSRIDTITLNLGGYSRVICEDNITHTGI